jgi:hypothetical protein
MSAAAIMLCARLVCKYASRYPGLTFSRNHGKGKGWQAVQSGEELDEMDDLSDLELGEPDEDHLLNGSRKKD